MDLDAAAGSILALLGENGAGKSTLVRILAGDYTPDAGEIDDRRRALLATSRPITRPRRRRPDDPPGVPGRADADRRREHLARPAAGPARRRPLAERARSAPRRVLEQMGVDLDPAAPVGSLADRRAADRRDRAGALRRGARADPRRADRRALAAGGRPALRLPAPAPRPGARRSSTSPTGSTRCSAISDRVQVLRDGSVAAEGETKDFDRRALVEAMIGRSAADVVRPPARTWELGERAGARARGRLLRAARSKT